MDLIRWTLSGRRKNRFDTQLNVMQTGEGQKLPPPETEKPKRPLQLLQPYKYMAKKSLTQSETSTRNPKRPVKNNLLTKKFRSYINW
jgi:hypothetical protein